MNPFVSKKAQLDAPHIEVVLAAVGHRTLHRVDIQMLMPAGYEPAEVNRLITRACRAGMLVARKAKPGEYPRAPRPLIVYERPLS
jgi:hypothetical protein